MMVEELIGVAFKKALEIHIPKTHILHSVINAHTVKLSYSTMPNMRAKIGAHNNKVEQINEPRIDDSENCDCSKTKKGQKYTCQWGGKCMEKGKVYKCSAVDKDGKIIWNYIGLTGGGIKPRISTHYTTFKYPQYETNTTLSEKVWEDSRKKHKMGIKMGSVGKSKSKKA